MAGQRTQAATLRLHGTIHGASVKLSDLFDGLQAGQDCDIGPAPAPGVHLILAAGQLNAIASQFGVDWHPVSGYATLSLERPARFIKHEEIIAALMPALGGDGMPPGSDVSLGPFASPTLPADVTAAPEVQSLDYEAKTGRFSATIQVAAPDSDLVTMRVTGRAEQSIMVLSLAHAMPIGGQLTAGDVKPVRIRKSGVRGDALAAVTDVNGMVLRQSLPAGATLLQDQFTRPMVVSRGRPVVLRLSSGSLLLTAAGTALESGGAGDRIHVINSLSHAVLVGQIMDGADIQIDAGTAPVFAQQTGGSGGLPRLVSQTSTSIAGVPGSAQEARYP